MCLRFVHAPLFQKPWRVRLARWFRLPLRQSRRVLRRSCPQAPLFRFRPLPPRHQPFAQTL
jgi:hypothetical protein